MVEMFAVCHYEGVSKGIARLPPRISSRVYNAPNTYLRQFNRYKAMEFCLIHLILIQLCWFFVKHGNH